MCGKCEVAEEDAVCTEDKAAEEDAGSRGICWWVKLVTEGCGARRGCAVDGMNEVAYGFNTNGLPNSGSTTVSSGLLGL